MFSSVMIGAITLPNSLLGLVLKSFRLLVESFFLSQLLSVVSGHFELYPLSRTQEILVVPFFRQL